MASQVSHPNVNRAAFCTVVALGAVTAASVFAAVTAATTVATVAYSILSITGAAVSIASISAWMDPKSTTVEEYFSNCTKHAGYTVAGAYQFVAQTFVQALLQGLANGFSKAMTRQVAGDDITVRHT